MWMLFTPLLAQLPRFEQATVRVATVWPAHYHSSRLVENPASSVLFCAQCMTLYEGNCVLCFFVFAFGLQFLASINEGS